MDSEEAVGRTRREWVLGATGLAAGSLGLRWLAKTPPAAAESSFVDTVSDQVIGGVKTFTKAPVVPNAALPQRAVVNLEADLAGKQPRIPPRTYVEVDPSARLTGSTDIYRFRPSPTGKAYFSLTEREATYAGTVDPVIQLGYNVSVTGFMNGENTLFLGMEADYNDGVRRTMEIYFQYISADGSSFIRPIFFQIDRETDEITGSTIVGNPLTVTNSEGETALYVDTTGASTSYVRGAFAVFDGAFTAHGSVALYPGDAGTSGYVGWLAPGGGRIGYMGASSSDVQVVLTGPASDLTVLGGGPGHNVGLFTARTSNFGAGDGVVALRDALKAPTQNPTGGGILYAEAGALKWRGSSGTVTVLAVA